MSSSSMCQTVYDTLRTVIYDTVHTVSFDTIRTFDTVKVQLDSNYSVQILHDAQQFYADSFNWLLGVMAVVFAVVIFASEKWSNRKLNIQTEKLEQNFGKLAEDRAGAAARTAATNATEKVAKEMEDKVFEIEKHIAKTIPNIVKIYLIQARLSTHPNDCLRYCLFAMEIMTDGYGENLLGETEIILGLLKHKVVENIQQIDKSLCKDTIETIENFEAAYFQFVFKQPIEKREAFMPTIRRCKAIIEAFEAI